MQHAADHRPDARLALALGAMVLACAGGAVVWATSVRARLPDPVARHWNASGAADGYSSLTATLAMLVGAVLLIAVPLGAAAVLGRQPAMLRRWLSGTAAFLTVFLTVLVVDSLRVQLDLTDAALAPSPGAGILLGTVLGVVVGALVAALPRSDPASARALQPPPAGALRLDDVEVDQLVWRSRRVGRDVGATVVALIAVVAIVALAAVLSWWLLPLAVVLVAILATLGGLSVVIDADGLSVRWLRLRLLHVPIADVAEADVVEVDPFWEFGGWGLRVDLAGRTGVVTRKGPAVRVRRGDGSQVLVTVDDAATAAATLNTLADRHQQLRA